MADYYTHFSFEVLVNKEQSAWFLKKLKELEEEQKDSNPNEPYLYGVNIEPDPERDSIWISDDGGQGDLDGLITFLEDFTKRFPRHKPIVLSWAHTCSSPRLNAYGGGAAMIYKGKSSVIDAHSWATSMANRLRA